MAFNWLSNYSVTKRQYIIKRGIQTQSGRFIGQIAANMAIERLQLKVAKLVSDVFVGEVEFLL